MLNTASSLAYVLGSTVLLVDGYFSGNLVLCVAAGFFLLGTIHPLIYGPCTPPRPRS